jgi:hypothetical protein
VFFAFKQVREPLQSQLVLADLPKSLRGMEDTNISQRWKSGAFPSRTPASIRTANQNLTQGDAGFVAIQNSGKYDGKIQK